MTFQRRCLNRDCPNIVLKSNSKYCCDECGIKVAREMLKEKTFKSTPEHAVSKLKLFSGTLVGADSEDLKMLEDIEKNKDAVKQSMLESLQKQKELETAIQFASTLYVASVPNTSDNGEEKFEAVETKKLDIIDCVTCGQPIPAKNYSVHIEQCFVKRLGASHYNKNSQFSQQFLCGCPTTEFPKGYCERTKKSCLKHVNWQNLRRGRLYEDQTRLKKRLETLEDEELGIRTRIGRRTNGNLQHITIAEA